MIETYHRQLVGAFALVSGAGNSLLSRIAKFSQIVDMNLRFI